MNTIPSTVSGNSEWGWRIAMTTEWFTGKSPSRTSWVCGSLPCMAPEMAAGGPYLPNLADCWSAGVVLLEMSGGMSSMSRVVPFDVDVDPQCVANDIYVFFDTAGSHAKALAFMGNVSDAHIIRILEMLLTPESRRHEMRDCLNSLPPV